MDTVNQASRTAWENSIGFRSIRTIKNELEDIVFNEEQGAFLNEEPIDFQAYKDIIVFDDGFPSIKDFSTSDASVMGRKGFVYAGEYIGTIRMDGSYWVKNRNKNLFLKALKMERSDEDNGITVYQAVAFHPDVLEQRSCSTVGNNFYNQLKIVSNGDQNGSSKLDSRLKFTSSILPHGNPNFYYYRVAWDWEGTSRRKSNGWWSTYPADHSFCWKIEMAKGLGNPVPITFTTIQGTDFHANNRTVERHIPFIDQTIVSASYINDLNNRYYIWKIHDVFAVPLGTFHTTNYLPNDPALHSCQ